MTWLWRTFFSALGAMWLAAPAPATTVRGSVELVASRDPMVRRHKDYSGVVVWLEPVFKREGVVRVFCNIHPQMSAVIVVLGTPYFAVSDKTGAFEIPNVPPGDYRFRVFHERAAPETLDMLARKITVETARLEMPAFSISESGYLSGPHKNKYGADYPPVIDAQPAYAGEKK
jgi:hypothetical protein